VELFTTSDINSTESMLRLSAFEPDVLLVVAFGQIFKEPVLKLPSKYCLNVHTSLLPRYRGAAPAQWAILNGDPMTGVTVQKMVRKLDAGDILVQKSVAISAEDTSATLLEKLAPLGANAVVEAFKKIVSGNDNFIPQDETKVSFAPKLDKAMAPIDWTMTAQQIRNRIRGLQPWPVAETNLGPTTLRVFEAGVSLEAVTAEPGTIFCDAKTRLAVACGGGTVLELKELQAPNRKRMPVAQFLSGFRGVFPFKKMG
jgi:methionyl-tRNA formyltransferase